MVLRAVVLRAVVLRTSSARWPQVSSLSHAGLVLPITALRQSDQKPEVVFRRRLSKKDDSQLLNALKCSQLKVGLLINFGESSLKWKRFVN